MGCILDLIMGCICYLITGCVLDPIMGCPPASLRSELNHIHASAIEHLRQTHHQESAAAKLELEKTLESNRTQVSPSCWSPVGRSWRGGGGWWSWDPILGSLEALNLRCSVSGAGAGGPDLGAAGGGVPEEEPRDPAGPPDPLAQREHQHSDQRAGAQGEGGAEDPQRSQSADQVGPEAPGPGPGPAGLQGPVLLLPLKCSRLRLREHASCRRRCGFSHCSLATTGVNVGLDISQLASAWEVEPTFLEFLTSLAELKSQLAAV